MHFKHKKTGHVLHKDHFKKVPEKQQAHFATTTEKPTHRYDDSVASTYNDDDDGSSFASTLLAIEAVEMLASDTTGPSADSTPDFGGFGGGDGGGGGAGGSYDSSSDSSSSFDSSSSSDSSSCDSGSSGVDF